MTYYCSECVMNWNPYQCPQGCCPECGSGTYREHEPASVDAEERFKASMRKRVERDRREHEHKLRVDDEKRRSAVMLATLEDLLHLPAFDPETGCYEQHGEAA